MADEQLFRTAISGFNKEDVIAYIDGINRASAENQDWFDRQSKAMADTIKRLTKENNKLKAGGAGGEELDKLRSQLEAKTKECQTLREQLKKAEEAVKNAALPEGNEQLKGRIEEIMREREGMQRRIAQADEQIAAMQAQAQQYQAALNEARSRISSNPSEGGAQLEQQLREAHAQNAQLEQELAYVRSQNGPSSAPELQAQLDEMRAQASKAQREQMQAQQQLAQVQQQFDSVRTQLEQTQQQAARQIDELTLQNRQLSTKLSNGGSAAAPLFRDAQNQSSFASEMRLREAQERNMSLDQEITRLRGENEYLKNNVVASPEEMRGLYDKSRLYDDIKNNVGKIISDARKKAADMISEAEVSSRQMLQQGMIGLSQMQGRIRVMKNEIDSAQKLYADTSISMSGMFNSIKDSVNITDNQLISILGSGSAETLSADAARQEQRPVSERPSRRTTGQEDIWRNQPL